MRTITINKKIRLWLLSGLLLLPFPATAEIMPQIALYHHPKYEHDFTHFDYADPQARKGGRIVMPAVLTISIRLSLREMLRHRWPT